jgi:hypothetical protein
VFFAEWLERLCHLTQVVLVDLTKELQRQVNVRGGREADVARYGEPARRAGQRLLDFGRWEDGDEGPHARA